MIRAIIFDLDNCLCPATEVGHELLEPMFSAIRRANHHTLSEDRLAQAFEDCWRHPLDWIAREYGFSDEMRRAAWDEAAQVEVKGRMSGYSDLSELSEIDATLFLVTTGFRRLQESKIKALGFESYFAAIFVDAVDEPNRKGKRGLFEEILTSYSFSPEEVLVVGDNPDSELAAGNSLGMPTVQMLRERVPRGTNATYYIQSLWQLQELLPAVTRENAQRLALNPTRRGDRDRN